MPTANEIDTMLDQCGEAVVLRRKTVISGVRTGVTDVALNAKVNYHGFKDLVAGGPAVQTDREVRIGTAAIAAAAWPAPPVKDDQVQIAGRWVTVQSVITLSAIAGTLGYVLMVRG